MFSESQIKVMRRLRVRDEWTLQRIADKYGVSRQRIRQLIGDTGRRPRNAERERAVRLHRRNLSVRQIAEMMHVERRTVRRFLQESTAQAKK